MQTKSYQSTSDSDMPFVGSGLVSVVIPAHNSADFLAETLQSVFAQTSLPLEVIVVDDGSTDDTAAIARSFNGVTVITQKNSGCAASRNTGSFAARGEFIAYLDADDLWAPQKLELQCNALKEHPEAAFSFTDYRAFDEHGFRKRESELSQYGVFWKVARKKNKFGNVVIKNDGDAPVLYGTSYIAPASLMVRRSDFLRVGGFDDTLWLGEDHEFCLRMFNIVSAVVVMKPLLFYRRHAAQGTTKTATKVRAIHFDIAQRVAKSPHRYPRGDVRYLARIAFLRHYRLAMLHARLGEFGEAVTHFELSLADRWTFRATLALAAARLCKSQVGRLIFESVRATWKRRPGPR